MSTHSEPEDTPTDTEERRQPREGDVVFWTKPSCQQCRMVKYRLEAAGIPYVEADITHPDHALDLAYFLHLGFASAPITEYRAIVVAGFAPSEVDRVIHAWRTDHPSDAS
ncbi:MAG: glutaredoxin family protein [Microbacterium sp.]|uniref:glutaredoxin family protein n=1 Tax=unclassified Microbacterium TaxID=2609290 RepID=UPI001AD4489F|nr:MULTISPECIES: glutaredoxin family protein [unclassified Microbacterium]MBN9210536.1 glutaredoxin family protein [Microbacterium sp.]